MNIPSFEQSLNTPAMCQPPQASSSHAVSLKEQPMMKRRVRFAEETTRIEIERRSEQERVESFYTPRELKMCQLKRRESVEAARADVFDERFHCLRGIEQFASFKIQKNLRTEKKMLYDLIFTEQERQNLAGTKDEESIRELSEMCSVYARNRALDAGAHDAAFATKNAPHHKRKHTDKSESPCFNRVMEEALAVLSPESKVYKKNTIGQVIPFDGYLQKQLVDTMERPLKRSRIQYRDPRIPPVLNTRFALSA